MKIKFDFNKIIGYFNLDSEKGLSVNSFRDWKVLLVCSSLFLVIVFSVDIYTLLNIKSKIDLVASGVKDNKELKINETDLNNVLEEMEIKAENFKRISGSSPSHASVSTTTPAM